MNLQQAKNEIVNRRDGIVEMKCSNCDDTFLIDEADFERVKEYTWHKVGKYIRAKVNNIAIYIHIFIKGDREGFEIDHKNRNRLDNRQDNLRYSTRNQNQWNKDKYKNNTSGFKGVSFKKPNNKWVAQIKLNGRLHIAGYFDTAREAAIAYNNKARELHGEFAVLNEL